MTVTAAVAPPHTETKNTAAGEVTEHVAKRPSLSHQHSIVYLFFARRFRPHRWIGLVYLLQFAGMLALLIGWRPFEEERNLQLRRQLTISLPVTGFIQACCAALTFTFLPRTGGMVQGYFTDKRTMSYDWIQENLFYSGILMFQVLYYQAPSRMPLPVELVFVFFPYFTVRRFVPKTSLRRSLANKSETTDDIRSFMVIQIWVVKMFYVFAKWTVGFCVNYLIFTRTLTPEKKEFEFLVQTMWLLGGWGTTVAMFLHTLKFKKYIGPKLSILLYTGSFPFFILSTAGVISIGLTCPLAAMFAAGGLACNFGPVPLQLAVQVSAAAALLYTRGF